METFLAPLDKNDGVATFVRLYLAVTKGVQAQLVGHSFHDAAFLSALDRSFADLFFAAANASAATRPRAWAPLFECRATKGILPLQFAIAGMNAHINRDLPVAIAATCARLRLEPSDSSPEHADYEQVNGILGVVEQAVKADYVPRWEQALMRLLPNRRSDDVVAMWDIRQAREAAWVNGETLWQLRGAPALRRRYLDTLDRSVGLASRAFLTPTRSWLARLLP